LQDLARYAYDHIDLGGQLWDTFRSRA